MKHRWRTVSALSIGAVGFASVTWAAAAPAVETIPEGTEIHVQLADRLSSATSVVGDTFAVVSDQDIKLADGTVIPAGYSGKGEVTVAEKNGALGRAATLEFV